MPDAIRYHVTNSGKYKLSLIPRCEMHKKLREIVPQGSLVVSLREGGLLAPWIQIPGLARRIRTEFEVGYPHWNSIFLLGCKLGENG